MRSLNSFLIIPIFLAAIHAQTKTIDFAELERIVEAEIAAAKTPGASVAITRAANLGIVCKRRKTLHQAAETTPPA